MAKFIKKIGWQKYEDYIEKQLSSPLLTSILQNIAMKHLGDEIDSDIEDSVEDDEDIDDDDDYEDQSSILQVGPMVPVTEKLMEDIAMLSSFDCWIGHTNFDLTHSTKDVLNKVPGVELLKIFSRYRFFIGIGTMFDFTKVRNDIEKALLEGD
jgi:hypothetical protein